MKITTLFLVIAGWLSGTAAVAQSNTPTPSGNATASTAPTSASQRQAADALLSAIYTEESFNQLIENTMTSQMKLHPELQRFQTEMLAFMRKYMSWSAIRPELAAMYAQEFTESELVEITRFYQSPVGQKAAAKIPVLMQNGMMIGQRRVQEHLPELEKIFKEKQAKAEHEHVTH